MRMTAGDDKPAPRMDRLDMLMKHNGLNRSLTQLRVIVVKLFRLRVHQMLIGIANLIVEARWPPHVGWTTTPLIGALKIAANFILRPAVLAENRRLLEA